MAAGESAARSESDDCAVDGKAVWVRLRFGQEFEAPRFEAEQALRFQAELFCADVGALFRHGSLHEENEEDQSERNDAKEPKHVEIGQ